MLRCFLPFLAAGVLLAPAAAQAQAQDCRSDAGASTGTLAAPQAPCRRTAPTPRKKDKDPPNVFRSGNTTIQFRGSVQMNTTVRGR